MAEAAINIFSLIKIDAILSILAVLVYLILIAILSRAINKYGIKKHIAKGKRVKIIRLSRLFLGLITVLILTLIWGLNASDIWIFGSVVFGFLGIAVFAVWSLLSNIFAAYVLFFSEPFQTGDFIIFKDGDNSIKGEVIDMTTFYVKVRLEDGCIANIPNNVTFQKVIIKYINKL